MPSSQSEFPLTLAEVLFDELEHSLKLLDDLEREPKAISLEVAKQIEEYREIRNGSDWNKLEDRIEEIKDLPAKSRKQIEDICDREKFAVNTSNDDLSDDIWKLKKALSKNLIPELYAISRSLSNERSALYLSGGGVRSAVFNLGILQGLARCGLLDKFDYLSTVSGGGLIGGWLTAWVFRRGPPSGKVPGSGAGGPPRGPARRPEEDRAPPPPQQRGVWHAPPP